MNIFGTEFLGVLFLLVATAATILMYYQWNFPYDKEAQKSSAPAWVTRTLRILGYIYVAMYLYMMWEMVPRLWTYQVELPARTVAHLVLGIAIGAMLFVKICIVRWFKSLEDPLAAILGTGMFICTVILIGLALPSFAREAYLQRTAFSPERQERLQHLLQLAGMEDPQERKRLASSEALQAGREVLLDQCIQCHDLRAVLIQPRTPANWRKTVERMANRSTFLAPISPDEQWLVTSYLVAISPTLQRTVALDRQQEQTATSTRQAVNEVRAADADYNPAAAKELFETLCTQCHDLEEVETWPPTTDEEVKILVERMVNNGLEAEERELAQVMRYMNERYVEGNM